MKKPNLNPRVLGRLLQYVRPYRRDALFSLLCALFVSAAALVIPVLSGRAIDAMAGSADPSRVHACLLLILLLASLSALCQQAMAVKNNHITCSVARDLRKNVIAHIMHLPLSYLDSHPTGDLVSRMISDVDTLSNGLLLGFTQLMTGVVTILGTLGIMLALDLRITLAVVLLTPFSLFTASFIARRTHRYFTAQAEVLGRETALINEMVEGQKVVRAFGYEKRALEDFDAVNEELGAVTLKATFFSSLTNPSTRLVNNVIYASVAFLAAMLALEKSITVGEMSVFLSYASQYAKPFNEISGVVTELENAAACAERVFELLDAESETPDADSSPRTLSGLVELKDVSFRYEEDRPLITHFSLRVEKGRRVAIVGPTGCGKTTLINLLMRFYDVDSGAIETDGTDIRTLSRHALRANYGMVLQETWLRSGTIRENIAYGCPEATEEEIISAAKRAHCHGFIRRLPQGYDTVIGENGGMLSQGQKQLLCIARVMLTTPSMLILDEATSSIDTRTEVLIQEAFSSLMRGRTSFIVAHRLSTIRDANVILVMENGHIAEQGDHDTLMQHDGAYRRLYRSQFEGIAT